MDRVSICYTLLILIFLKNLKISIPLLIFTFMVNEKIIIIFGPILLARYLIDKKSKFLLVNINYNFCDFIPRYDLCNCGIIRL